MANIQFGKQNDDGMGKPAQATAPGKAAPGQPQGKDPNEHPAVKQGMAPPVPTSAPTGQNPGQMPSQNKPQAPGAPAGMPGQNPAKQPAMPQVNPQEAQMLREAAQVLAKFGRGKDTILAHVTPEEVDFLKRQGGSGTTNPVTGLLEFDNSGSGNSSFYGAYNPQNVSPAAPNSYTPSYFYNPPTTTTSAPTAASTTPAAGSGVPGSPAVPATPLTAAAPPATPSTPNPTPTPAEVSIANPAPANNNPYGASQYSSGAIGQQGAMGRAGSYGDPSVLNGVDPYTQTGPSNPLQATASPHVSAPDVMSSMSSGTPSSAGALSSTPGAPSGNALQGTAAPTSSSTGAGNTAAVGTGNTDLLSMFLAGQNNQGGTYSG